MKRLFRVILCIILIAGLVYTPVTIPQITGANAVAVAEAATVKINKKKATIYKGTAVQLKIQGTKKKVTWTSGNKKVATVTKTGKVTGKKTGTATIKGKVNGKTYSCKVTVKAIPEISKKKLALKKGDRVTLTLDGYKIGKVTWSSSNENVAAVNAKGEVTAKKAGTAAIRAKVGGVTLECRAFVRLPKTTIKKLPRETYTITYVMNKGTNAESNPATYTEGDRINLAEPIYENHVFKGWYTDKACTEEFSGITPKTKGNLTLYAKWHLAALNIQGEGMEDMIWSWWYYPQVISDVSDGTKVHWGYATKDGYCGVAQYDEKTGVTKKNILKKAAADDHNGMALTLLDDKRIMCVYASGHNVDNEMHIRISDNPLDINSFSTDIVLESSGKTCYGQIIKSSGKYYLFYRVNNSKWAYRTSPDGTRWTDETIFVKASMQYYCKVVPTTTDGMLRIVMYSNPAQVAPEIRMGFLNTKDNTIYNADATTKLEASENSYDIFQVIQEVESGKKHRLFDVAVTDVNAPRFLFASFTKKSNVNDAVYYLHDAGNVYKICEGGRYLMDANYQLGAAFVDKNTIVAGRNQLGSDYIELYKFDGAAVTKSKTVSIQSGTGFARSARPIVDVNGKAILWHNGYYDYKAYTDFDTDAQMYLFDSDKVIGAQITGLDAEAMGRVKAENVETAKKYINKLYNDNTEVAPLKGNFTWQLAAGKPSWIYYTGLVHEGFLMTDVELYKDEVQEFYTAHIKNDGSIRNYAGGTLDAALPAVNMITLLYSDELTESERVQYQKAVNYVYNQLEKQTVYTDAGNLLQHSQDADGNPRAGWDKWNICLDGIYMSQLFNIRLAQAIDDGIISITDKDGAVVASNTIWNDVYKRMIFVMQKMKSGNTGLPFHGYCVADKESNKAYWSRGIGWYSMVLMEAAEKMPNKDKREILGKYFNNLMAAVIAYQDSETFLWYNVPDSKDELTLTKEGTVIKNIPESSGSAMFAYSLLRGYHSGLLADEEYYKAGLRAYNSLVETKLTEDGLTDNCFSSAVHSNPAMYMHSGYVTNDGKGVGPFIMATNYAY